MLTTAATPPEPPQHRSVELSDAELILPQEFAKRIVLVRHGKSAGNVLSHRPGKDFYLPHGMTDETLPLTDRGKAQATEAGRWLADKYPEGFDVILASPFLRAQKTAECACLSAGWEDQQIISEPLAEERNWGVFLDVHLGQQRRFKEGLVSDRRGGRIPGGESLDEARDRAHTFLRRIHTEFGGKQVLVFTHGEFMQECIAAALEDLNQPTNALPRQKPKNCQIFELTLQTYPEETASETSPVVKKKWHLRTACPAERGLEGWREVIADEGAQ